MNDNNFLKLQTVQGIVPDTYVSVGDFIVQLLCNVIVV